MGLYFEIGVAVAALVVVALIRKRWTSWEYEGRFGVPPGKGTLAARWVFITDAFRDMVDVYQGYVSRKEDIEYKIRSATGDDRDDLFVELQRVLRYMRQSKNDINYACRLVRRREGKHRAHILLDDNYQYLKPRNLRQTLTRRSTAA